MTYTKRQWLVYRTKQSVNMLSKSINYLAEVQDIVEGTKYKKQIRKLYNKLFDIFIEIKRFQDKLKSMELTKS